METFKEFLENYEDEPRPPRSQKDIWAGICKNIHPGSSKRSGKGIIERGSKSNDARFADLSNAWRINGGDWMTLDRIVEILSA